MFNFAWPWMLILILLPILIRNTLPKARKEQVSLKVSFLDELETINQNSRGNSSSNKKMGIYFLIYLLLVIALARPQWLGEPIYIEPEGRDMMFVLDTSGSMSLDDMQWNGKEINRLDLIKKLFVPFVQSRTGDRLGMILFGSYAVELAPLTADRETIKKWLDESYIGQAGEMTAIGDGLALGVKKLLNEDEKSRVMVLLSDGTDNASQISPEQATELAKQAKVKVYTIGVGSDSLYMSRFGFVPASFDLDEKTLTRIAEETGGKYFRARGNEDLRQIIAEIDALEPVKHEKSKVQVVTEYYSIPLMLAMLLGTITICSYALFDRKRSA